MKSDHAAVSLIFSPFLSFLLLLNTMVFLAKGVREKPPRLGWRLHFGVVQKKQPGGERARERAKRNSEVTMGDRVFQRNNCS